MQEGFSVFEMVIVVAIIVLIASLILANQSGFSERLKVRSAAEDIASSVRMVQAYGLGVKEFGIGSGNFPGYGIYFQSVSPSSYIVFADTINPTQYQYDGSAEKISDASIQNSIRIYDLCVNQKQTSIGPCGRTELTAVYLRPTPNVSLKSGGSSYSDIEIKIRSPKGFTKTIVLWQSGQVSIE